MKKLLLLPIFIIWVNVKGQQFKAGMLAGTGKAPLVGIQAGYEIKGFYINGNLFNKFSASEPSQAEIRLNYTRLRLSPYIGLNRELYNIGEATVKKKLAISYGLQWQGRNNPDAFFNRLGWLFISAGMVEETPMVLVGGLITF